MTCASPICHFVLVLAIAVGARLLLPRSRNLPTASGAVVMAIGIFALAALQRMPFPARLATQFIALEMLIVWTYLALHYAACAVQGTLHRYSGDPVQGFAIGTWVAGCYEARANGHLNDSPTQRMRTALARTRG